MNVQHAFALVEAVHRAHDNTVGVFAVVAGLADNVRHDIVSPGKIPAAGDKGPKLLMDKYLR
jgi:hypothetical protein